jgi:hypothetical protein
MWRIAGRVVFRLWCLSWLPTVVGMMTETFRPPTPQEHAVRLICALNAMIYYVGGGWT